nr:MAG TPA: hypothetical protein [Caudoviricetes sp.]
MNWAAWGLESLRPDVFGNPPHSHAQNFFFCKAVKGILTGCLT